MFGKTVAVHCKKFITDWLSIQEMPEDIQELNCHGWQIHDDVYRIFPFLWKETLVQFFFHWPFQEIPAIQIEDFDFFVHFI